MKRPHKLQDPKLLQIDFHILRHWQATTEYAKTQRSALRPEAS
jgi:hypothetical protein